MTQISDKLIEKIQKLFALADPARGGTEAEAESAMRMANALMEKHQLSMADVEASAEDQTEAAKSRLELVVEDLAIGGKRLVRHVVDLGSAVRILTDTRIVLGWKYSNRVIHWIGDRADVAVARALFVALRETMTKLAEVEMPSGFCGPAGGGELRRLRRSYMEGMAARFVTRAREIARNRKEAARTHERSALTGAQCQALAIVSTVKLAEVRAFQDERFGKLGKWKAGRASADHEAWNAGWTEGGQVSLEHGHSLPGGQG